MEERGYIAFLSLFHTRLSCIAALGNPWPFLLSQALYLTLSAESCQLVLLFADHVRRSKPLQGRGFCNLWSSRKRVEAETEET